MHKERLKKRLQNKKGFTLVELLLVVAIIVVLSGIILVGVSSYRKKANRTKVLTEVGGQLQNITMCFSDDMTVNSPSGNGGNLCGTNPNYGSWPALPEGWSYGDSDFTSSNDWFIEMSGEEITICCNSKYSKCGEPDGGCSSTAGLE
ncbi:MAG: hypothetical protein CSA81_14070 [Acidobacteria bacterium]|nr:MAG: hypothetical protein CSA81_14070 [Acidobacteriota bacterium]